MSPAIEGETDAQETPVVFVTALAGCGKVTTDIAVHDDGAYDLSLIMVAAETELATTGYEPQAFIDLMIEEFESQPGIEDFTLTEYQQDGYAGLEITGTDIPGDDVGMFGTGILTADSDFVYFDLQYPITILTSSFTPEQTEAIEIRTSVTFPGEVTEHNGEFVGDTTVEWVGTGSNDLDYTATAEVSGGASTPTDDPTQDATDDATDEATTDPTDEATDDAAAESTSDDEGTNWLLWVGIGVGVLALAGVAVWLILRNRSKTGPGGPGAPGGQQWGAYQQGQPGQQQWGQQPGQGGQPGQQPWGQPDQGGQQWGQPGQQQPGQQGQPGQQWGQPQPPEQPGQQEPPQWGKPQ